MTKKYISLENVIRKISSETIKNKKPLKESAAEDNTSSEINEELNETIGVYNTSHYQGKQVPQYSFHTEPPKANEHLKVPRASVNKQFKQNLKRDPVQGEDSVVKEEEQLDELLNFAPVATGASAAITRALPSLAPHLSKIIPTTSTARAPTTVVGGSTVATTGARPSPSSRTPGPPGPNGPGDNGRRRGRRIDLLSLLQPRGAGGGGGVGHAPDPQSAGSQFGVLAREEVEKPKIVARPEDEEKNKLHGRQQQIQKKIIDETSRDRRLADIVKKVRKKNSEIEIHPKIKEPTPDS